MIIRNLSIKISLIFYLVILFLGWGASTIYRDLKNPIDKNLELLNYTWSIINNEYLDQKQLNSQKLMYGAVRGMVASVGDPFTTFLTPSEHRAFQNSLRSEFEGTGIQVQKKQEKVVIKAVLNNSPGKNANIQTEDVILSINNIDIKAIPEGELTNLLNGKKGSQLTLNLYKTQLGISQNIILVCEQFTPNTVEYKKIQTQNNKQISYIKISRFGSNTLTEWKELVPQVIADNPFGIVLDLRDNWGGYTEVPVFVASEFIKSGTIYSFENSKGEKKSYTVDRKGSFLDVPMVVLVNKGSISATEMLAGSIQFYKRGLIIGTKSFGKGSIQAIHTLFDGSGLHITTEKWYLPDGSSVENKGLIPDKEIISNRRDIENGADNQLVEAVNSFDR